MDIQNYLEQFDISRKKAELLHTEYDQEMNILQSIAFSPYYDDLFRNDKRLISARVKARKLKDLERNELKICDEVKAIIDQVPGIKGQILRSRYISCDKWEQIAEQLYYSSHHVQRLHQEALEELGNTYKHNNNN